MSPSTARRPAQRSGGKRFRHIVHASDFSPASRRAFDTALRLAKVDGATLTLVHVLDPAVPWVEVDYASSRAYELITSARNAAAKQLDALVRKAKVAGVRSMGRLVDGDPRDAITRAAKRLHADLVVVGTHGRTGLDKLLLGSVAERTVATAPCPVLTVRRR